MSQPAEHHFDLQAPFAPAGSQPQAIAKLVAGIQRGSHAQTLLGVTGSGKTFTMACVIAQVQRPALVIAHNKTLAAQLYNEFREFLPHNRVEYFVSYYDYYQPESYIPQKDQYIEKDALVNPKLDQMRLATTASLLARRDTVVVASVSCIYGLGKPDNFQSLGFELHTAQAITRQEIIARLVAIQYERNDMELEPGRFRVRGDTIDLVPSYGSNIVRIEFFGAAIERILDIHRTSGQVETELDYFYVYPARHFVITPEEKERAVVSILAELEARLPELDMLAAHRLRQRTLYDIEMIRETGYCKGIENYSRHFDGRAPSEKPYCLLDYFPGDFLLFIDESHQTLPQLHAMYNGDYTRKKMLVDYGFRLPSAFDNRPLRFDEFESYMRQVIFVSATPGDFEVSRSGGVVEQIIRPTGLIDPPVEVRPVAGQIADLRREIIATINRGDRVLVTTLTKKLAEEMSEYLAAEGIKTRYLHSEIDTLDRNEIIRELRLGQFDVLVGINLLREGLDIPEVGFIGILDADKEGFLRDARSLIQIIGRAARNINAKVVLYADRMTGGMQFALQETARRRTLQLAYNEEHHIEPQTIIKPVKEKQVDIKATRHIPKADIPNALIEFEELMRQAADRLDFEEAIRLREQIKALQKRQTEAQ